MTKGGLVHSNKGKKSNTTRFSSTFGLISKKYILSRMEKYKDDRHKLTKWLLLRTEIKNVFLSLFRLSDRPVLPRPSSEKELFRHDLQPLIQSFILDPPDPNSHWKMINSPPTHKFYVGSHHVFTTWTPVWLQDPEKNDERSRSWNLFKGLDRLEV